MISASWSAVATALRLPASGPRGSSTPASAATGAVRPRGEERSSGERGRFPTLALWATAATRQQATEL
eukprot:6654994-Pyramimonas_sp.AAC.1